MIHEIWFSGGFCHGFYKVCVFLPPPHSNFPQEAAFPLYVGGDDDDDDDGVQLAARDKLDVEITRSL